LQRERIRPQTSKEDPKKSTTRKASPYNPRVFGGLSRRSKWPCERPQHRGAGGFPSGPRQPRTRSSSPSGRNCLADVSFSVIESCCFLTTTDRSKAATAGNPSQFLRNPRPTKLFIQGMGMKREILLGFAAAIAVAEADSAIAETTFFYAILKTSKSSARRR